MFRNAGILGLVLAVLGMAMSCGVWQKVEETLIEAKAGVMETKKLVKVVTTKLEAVDTDKDGKWSLEEIFVFLGLPGLTLAGIARNILSNIRKSKNENEVKAIKEAITASTVSTVSTAPPVA